MMILGPIQNPNYSCLLECLVSLQSKDGKYACWKLMDHHILAMNDVFMSTLALDTFLNQTTMGTIAILKQYAHYKSSKQLSH